MARDCIFECNASSNCPPDCFNRVVGRGVRARLQVFKTLGRFGRGLGLATPTPNPNPNLILTLTLTLTPNPNPDPDQP